MSDKKKNSLIIGYNYILFQSNLRNFVKCWYDGSEDYDYIHRDDFVELFRKIGSNDAQIICLNKYLDSTSLYVWDVDNNIVFKATKDNRPEYTLGQDVTSAIRDAVTDLEKKSTEFSINRNVDFL